VSPSSRFFDGPDIKISEYCPGNLCRDHRGAGKVQQAVTAQVFLRRQGRDHAGAVKPPMPKTF